METFIEEKISDETKEKISAKLKGKSLSDETCKKMSEARKGEKHHFYGKSKSEEHRQKIAASLTGKTLSDETKAKISAAQKGKPKPNSGGHPNPHKGEPWSQARREAHIKQKEARNAK